MMDQSSQLPIEPTNTTEGPKLKKRPTWLIAILITLGVVLFFAAVYGVVGFLLFKGLKGAGTYLNGAPISVSDSTVETRIRSDLNWLLEGDYDTFDKDLALSDQQLRYRSAIDTLQQPGNCSLQATRITKGQGGFDGGASINYEGTVKCSGNDAYRIVAQYHGSALSKKDAADMDRFTLTEAVAETDNEDLIRAYAQQDGQPISVNVIPANAPDNQQIDSRMYATYDEYVAATKSGELQACSPDGTFNYAISFRWRDRRTPSELSQYLSPPVFRCK